MKKIILVLLTLFLFFLSGCWDAKDLGKSDIAIIATYDLAQESEKLKPGDRVVVDLQTPVMGEDVKEKAQVVESVGQTVGEGRNTRGNRSSRYVSITAIRSLIFGESLASEGLGDVLDIVYRNPFLSYTVKLAVVDGYAKDLLKVEPKSFPYIGEEINGLLTYISQQNFVPQVNLAEFHIDETNYGRNPVLPVIAAKAKDKIEISGVAIFKKDFLVGKIDATKMVFLTLLRGDKGHGVITFPLPGEEEVLISLQGANSRKVKVGFEEDRAIIDIDIFFKGDIIEVEKSNILDKYMDKFELVKQGAKDYMESNCLEVLSTLQNDYRVDALNTGAVARARYGKSIEHSDWDELFSNADIRVNAHVKIRNHGSIQ